MLLKRLLDLVVSLTAVVLLSPVLLLLAAAVKLSSPGAAFYKGLRVGRHGRPFRMVKFRTMAEDAERKGGSCTSRDDPRITTLGRFLRRYKLDELPQFVNVFKGEMSLVGPRPEVQVYVDLFTPEQREILSVRPGITDWATLWNPDEEAILAGAMDPEQVYLTRIRPEKLRLQLEYVRRRSFWVDLRILLATLRVILRSVSGFSPAAAFREQPKSMRGRP